MTRKRKTERHEYDTPTRARFIFLVEAGYSHSKAARKTGVPRTTGEEWLKTGTRRTGTTREGRPRQVPDNKMEEIIAWMNGHYSRRTMDRVAILKQWGYNVDESTAKRAFA